MDNVMRTEPGKSFDTIVLPSMVNAHSPDPDPPPVASIDQGTDPPPPVATVDHSTDPPSPYELNAEISVTAIQAALRPGDIAHISPSELKNVIDKLMGGSTYEGITELLMLITRRGLDFCAIPPTTVVASDLHALDGIVELRVPANYIQGRGYAYIIACGFDVASKHVVLKYGKTEDLASRFEAHKRTFSHSTPLAVVDVGSYSPSAVENSFKSLSRCHKVQVHKHHRCGRVERMKECFAVRMSDFDRELNRLLAHVLSEHRNIVCGVENSRSVLLDDRVRQLVDELREK